MFGITSQIRRAASSIPANLAEGCTRRSPKEFQQFLSIARGSLAEIEVWLQLSHDLQYLKEADYSELHAQCDEIGKMFSGLLKSL